jgi:hypothetical protein
VCYALRSLLHCFWAACSALLVVAHPELTAQPQCKVVSELKTAQNAAPKEETDRSSERYCKQNTSWNIRGNVCFIILQLGPYGNSFCLRCDARCFLKGFPFIYFYQTSGSIKYHTCFVRSRISWQWSIDKVINLVDVIHRVNCCLGAGMATCYGLDGKGIGVPDPVGSRFFFSSLPNGFWGTPILQSNG